MNESQISVRYAKALFQSASEKQILDQVYGDMELLSDTCKLDDFQYMMEVPSLQPSQKSSLVDSIFKTYISDASIAMINLVIKNKNDQPGDQEQEGGIPSGDRQELQGPLPQSQGNSLGIPGYSSACG